MIPGKKEADEQIQPPFFIRQAANQGATEIN